MASSFSATFHQQVPPGLTLVNPDGLTEPEDVGGEATAPAKKRSRKKTPENTNETDSGDADDNKPKISNEEIQAVLAQIRALPLLGKNEQPALVPHGIQVVQVLSSKELAVVHNAIVNAEFPEFLEQYNTIDKAHFAPSQYVQPGLEIGGFGAYGFASSFHHPTVRKLRALMKRRIVDFLQIYDDECKYEYMFDRLAARSAYYGELAAEAWHQDLANKAMLDKYRLDDPDHPKPLIGGKYDHDIVFGGWVNLNMPGGANQKFTYVPGTQDIVLPGNLGEEGFVAADPRLYEDLKARMAVIIVPPGCALLIQQGLIHCISPSPPSESYSVRLFHGIRLTYDNRQVYEENYTNAIKNLGVPVIPSGQVPPMYSKNHIGPEKNREKMQRFVTKMRDWVKTEYTMGKKSKNPGLKYLVPGTSEPKAKRSMLSLRQLGVWTEPQYDYTKRDRDVLMPQTVAQVNAEMPSTVQEFLPNEDDTETDVDDREEMSGFVDAYITYN